MQVKQRITNVWAVTPQGMTWRDVLIEGERIAALVQPDTPTGEDWQRLDGGGAVLFPGMIDLLQHGMGAHLYADAEKGAVDDASHFLLRHGATAFLPSIGCQPKTRLTETLAVLAGECARATGARALGVHSEGPCFALTGAHNPENLDKPDAALAERMLEATGGRLAATTVAPELRGAEPFIRTLKAAGVSIHLGHSDAPPERIPEFLGWGIDAVTHMFDVLPQKGGDGTGVHVLSLTDALMAEPGLPLGLVCDGIHAQPKLVQLLAQLPSDRVFLETDAMKFAGCEETEFEFYPGYRVRSAPGKAVRDARGGLCGSSLVPDEALRNFLRLTGVDLARAAHATSLVPARVVGRERDLGSIEAGKLADLVLLDPATLGVQATMVGGAWLYRHAA